jgi:hypothetical protein
MNSSGQLAIALTLTLKQSEKIVNPRGISHRKITPDDARRAADHFLKMLDRQVYGHSARRHGKTLPRIVVLQGLKTDKRLHLHMAIGGLPPHVKLTQFRPHMLKAKSLVPLLDDEYDLQVADSGWIDYMDDELAKKDTDTVLWEQCHFGKVSES